jgi:hypothetical protein
MKNLIKVMDQQFLDYESAKLKKIARIKYYLPKNAEKVLSQDSFFLMEEHSDLYFMPLKDEIKPIKKRKTHYTV